MIDAKRKIVILAYCLICWTQTYQTFDHEDGRFEYYVCDTCGHVHAVAVR